MTDDTPHRKKVTIRYRGRIADDPARIQSTAERCFDAGADEVEFVEGAEALGPSDATKSASTSVPDEPRETELAAAGNAAIEANRAARAKGQREKGLDPDERHQADPETRLSRREALKKAGMFGSGTIVGATLKKIGEAIGDWVSGGG